MITSKLSVKARTRIPKAVRTALGVEQGDELAYAIEHGRVIVTKVREESAEKPFGVFQEWNGPADRAAYGKL